MGHMTITTPLLEWFVICLVRLDIASLCTKFDSSSLCCSLDIGWVTVSVCNQPPRSTQPPTLSGMGMSTGQYALMLWDWERSKVTGWPRHRLNATDTMIAKLCAWTAQTAQTVSPSRLATAGNQTHSCFELQQSHLAYCASVAELSIQ